MPRNETMNDNVTSELDVFKMTGRALGKGISTRFDAETLKKAHQYVLFNCDDVSTYIEQYRTVVEQAHPHVSRHQFECIHSEIFADWFAQKVSHKNFGEYEEDTKLWDPTEQEWKVVVSTTAREHYNMESTIDVETYLQSNICIPLVTVEIGDFGWVREDVDGIEIDINQ
ncbi:hypothetical protein C2S51_009046 [Perilla frutescens var. frutescens]|nr:hypothetical protein C2S51_009046 [Perilla frutescens var. frutescens]